MTLTIHADAELRGALSKVHSFDSQQGADHTLARTVWSRLCEPGDALAGRFIQTLGPTKALRLLVAGGSDRQWTAAFQQTIGATETEGDRQSADTMGQPTAKAISTARERWLARLDRAATLADLTLAAQAGLTILTPECQEWPSMLDDLGSHAPQLLWIRGKHETLRGPALAVVGARACTGYGSQVTADLTAEACAAGMTIVSGAAYGVDAVAHRTALATGSPTIAVLAGGADRPYPAAHDQLLERISEHGAVCSELPPGSAPTRWRFLQRNRLIAAFSRGVLVTEAGMRSGTLNTAGHASELGRAIGAVPGPINSASSVGCHRLIREYDATLITNGPELLELLSVDPHTLDLPESSDRELSLHVRVLDALPLRGSRPVSEIAKIAGIDDYQVRGALAELELLGRVRFRDSPQTGRQYALAGKGSLRLSRVTNG